MRPLRVFLCHASQDKPAVRKLHRYLKQRGVQPWLDELDLLPGENWEVEIPNEIFSSDVILVCLSKNSVDKEGYVQKEISFALDKALEKPEGTIFIVPVKLESCDVPKRLNRFQWVDLYRPDGYKRLMLGLQKRANGLGADVSPVILDEIRKTSKPEKKKVEEPISVSVPLEEGTKEESKKEIPASQQETKEAEVKFTQKKPFTKLLVPSSLSPNGTLHLQGEDLEKTEREAAEKVAREKKEKEIVRQYLDEKAERNRRALVERAKKERNVSEFINKVSSFFSLYSRQFGIGGIILLVFIFGGFGLNYLIKNPPIAIVTTSPTETATPKFSTPTKESFTPTSTPSKTSIPTPALRIGSTMIGNHGETLVYVPAGEFRMGSENGEDDEKPVHTVYLDAFWIDQYEVTNKQYQACVDTGTCELPSFSKSYTHSSYYGNSEFDNYPVLYVSWDQANRYCEVWAGGDLPTESQWEKAARGTDERVYPWGNDVPNKEKLMNYNQNVGDATEVGKYPDGKSPYGVHDMAGNVWEWVNDSYQSNYYAVLGDSVSDPVGPESGDERVLRGGSWYSSDYSVRSAYRYKVFQSNALYTIGFRCARTP